MSTLQYKGYRVFLAVVVGYRYQTPLVFSYLIFICWVSSCQWKLLWKVKKRQEKIFFWFQLYFTWDFCTVTLLRGMSSWSIWGPSFFPNEALRSICRFRWLIIHIQGGHVQWCLHGACFGMTAGWGLGLGFGMTALLAADITSMWNLVDAPKQACYL